VGAFPLARAAASASGGSGGPLVKEDWRGRMAENARLVMVCLRMRGAARGRAVRSVFIVFIVFAEDGEMLIVRRRLGIMRGRNAGSESSSTKELRELKNGRGSWTF